MKTSAVNTVRHPESLAATPSHLKERANKPSPLDGLTDTFGKLARGLALTATLVAPLPMAQAADTVLATASAPAAAPKARAAVEANTIPLDSLKETSLTAVRSHTEVVDTKGNKVRFSVAISEDGSYMVLNVDATGLVKRVIGSSYEIRAVINTADGLWLEMEPQTNNQGKWGTYLNVNGSYAAPDTYGAVALPLSGTGENRDALIGSTLYVGVTRNGDYEGLLRERFYNVAKIFEKTSSQLPETEDSVNKLFAPGETANSAPISLSTIPEIQGITLPYSIPASHVIGGKIRVTPKDGTPGAFSNSAEVTSLDDILEIQVTAQGSGTPNEAYAMINGVKISFDKVITLPNKTVAASSISTNSNSPTVFEGVKITIPTGATEVYLTRKKFDGTTENIPYTSGMLIQPDNIGFEYRLLFKNAQGTIEKFYFKSLPSLVSKKVPNIALSPNGTQDFSMTTLNSGNYTMFNSTEQLLAGIGADSDRSLSIAPGLKVQLVDYSKTSGVTNWKVISDATLQPGTYNYTGNFTHDNYLEDKISAHDFKWTFNVQ